MLSVCRSVLLVPAAAGLLVAGQGSPPSPADKVAAQLLEIAGEDFRIRQTEHFTICYDGPYSTLSPHVGRLEGTYDATERFCRANGVVSGKLEAPLPVLFFKESADFARYAAAVGMQTDSVAGFYLHKNNVAAFLNTLNNPEIRRINEQIGKAEQRLRRLNVDDAGTPAGRKALSRDLTLWRSRRDALVERFNRLVLQHEAAHQVMFNLGVHVRGAKSPSWLVEGLACQFEVPQSDLSGVLRNVNQMRLADLREAMGVPPEAKDQADVDPAVIFGTGRLVPLAKLVSDDDLFVRPPIDRTVLYAEAWGLVAYLHRERRESFAKYLGLLGRRLPGEVIAAEGEINDFEKTFGQLGEGFDREWIKFILRLRFEPSEAGQ